MRVLIILSLACATTFASSIHLHSAPAVAYTQLEPKSSYEYSSAVNTHNYQNYQHVKSNIEEPVVKVVQPATVAVETYAPIVKTYQPIVEHHHVPTLVKTVAYAHQPAIATIKHAPEIIGYKHQEPTVVAVKQYAPAHIVHEPAVLAVKHVEQPSYVHHEPKYVHEEPAYVHDEPAYVHQEPAYIHHEPDYVHHEPTVVAYKHYEPTVVAVKQHEPIVAVHHEQPTVYTAAAAAVATPIVESIVETKVVGEAVVDHGILATKSQYHAQNTLGEASYGHAEPSQTHNAIQDAAGNKAGSFSYVSPDGRVLTTDYVADEHGYRAASNALPVHHVKRRSISSIVPLPLLREQTHTSIVHNPGHAVSHRVDTVDHVPELHAYHTTVPVVKTILPHATPLYATHSLPSFYNAQYLTSPYYSHAIVPQTYSTYATIPTLKKDTYHSTTVVH